MNRSGPLPRGMAELSLSANASYGTATSVSGSSGCAAFHAAAVASSASRSAPLYACHSTIPCGLLHAATSATTIATSQRIALDPHLGLAVEQVHRVRIDPDLYGLAGARRRRRVGA